MKVVGGKFKGQILDKNISRNTKPTNNKVKESIFNILNDKIQDSVFVDLFSGSGSVGLEALSRGAKKVYFNDKDRNAVRCIYNNIYKFKATNFQITSLDYKQALDKIGEKADIVFIDAPFFKLDINKVIFDVLEAKIMDESGVIIAETDIKTNLAQDKRFHYKVYKYGRIKLYKITPLNQ